MSGTSVEESTAPRRLLTAGSTDPDVSRRVFRHLRLSAETLKRIAGSDASVGIVTCYSSAGGKGKSWIFESPTFRADRFHPTGLLNPTEGLSSNLLLAPVSPFTPCSV